MQKKLLSQLKVLIAGLALFTAAASADETRAERDYTKQPPSGTVEFDATSVKFLVGTSWGQGTLHYQGKSYPFKVRSLSAGGIGYREIKGTGKVFELKRLQDFPGTYLGAGAGVTVDDKHASPVDNVMENGKGVILHSRITDSEGLQLSLSAGGLEIEFAE